MRQHAVPAGNCRLGAVECLHTTLRSAVVCTTSARCAQQADESAGQLSGAGAAERGRRRLTESRRSPRGRREVAMLRLRCTNTHQAAKGHCQIRVYMGRKCGRWPEKQRCCVSTISSARRVAKNVTHTLSVMLARQMAKAEYNTRSQTTAYHACSPHIRSPFGRCN